MLFDWSRKLAPSSQPIRCKLKPIAPWSLAFSRATGRLHAFTSSCHWLPLIISFTLIGRCDYFGFGFRHSIEKRSKCYLWNVIHISLVRELPSPPHLLVLSRYKPTLREKRNSYQFNKSTVPHPRLLVLSPYPPPPSENVIHISLIRVLSLSPFTRAFSLPTTPQGKT